MVKRSCFSLSLMLMTLFTQAMQLYVNTNTGNDANPGTKTKPIRTIREASVRVNADAGKSADTIVLSQGVYLLTETVLFNNQKYAADSRLMIRAESLPDDPDWNPQRMPIIVTLAPTRSNGNDEMARGLEIETGHVTIQGLRFTGSPNYYYMDGRHNRCSYPIWREGDSLDDLLVTQCLFAGNRDVLPLRVAVIAKGHGLVVDHCVFFNCENPVVFWDAAGGVSHHDAMRFCLVYGANYSGVWTTPSTAEDFEFHHNIIANCRAAWISENKGAHYQVHDCIFSGNSYMAGTGGGKEVKADFMNTTNVQASGAIEIEKDPGRNNYLQLKAGSSGSELKAGLFKN